MTTYSDNKVSQAVEAIKTADALLIAAGAGMGVDSGLPDFRGAQGFWRAYPALEKLGLSFEEMADPVWFSQNPHLAWAFYGHRLNLYRQTLPHQGFSQLLEIAKAKAHGYFVFTSNVDGQFQRAGFAVERMVECHGSINHFQCTAPCTDEIWDAATATVSLDEGSFRAVEPLPQCRNCSAQARPNILMFGDGSWLSQRTGAEHADPMPDSGEGQGAGRGVTFETHEEVAIVGDVVRDRGCRRRAIWRADQSICATIFGSGVKERGS